MNLLIQVGKTLWVDPDAIEAINWNYMLRCPTIILRNGQHIYAAKFKDKGLDNEETCTNELLAFIKKAVRETTAPVFSGRKP